MEKVLVLGAGRVSGPLIEYLNQDPLIQITVGKNNSIFLHEDRRWYSTKLHAFIYSFKLFKKIIDTTLQARPIQRVRSYIRVVYTLRTTNFKHETP